FSSAAPPARGSPASATAQLNVKTQEVSKAGTDAESTATGGYSGWGFHADISGKVANHTENTRSTDKSAKYDIYARAVQQQPVEGMARDG
ncbi:MAG: DUF2589 domain-containing protein, partial [Oscillospiraceae bacterium]|nr:DUF2589 domain-containing protein [Oscillospiraceae bacterium]